MQSFITMAHVHRLASSSAVTRILTDSKTVLPSSIVTRFIVRHLFSSPMRVAKDVTTTSAKKALIRDDDPIVFTQSPAYKDWKAMYLIELPDHRPPIQRPVCLTSLIIFLLYFLVFREENDLDELIYQPLIKTVPDMELPLLEAAYDAHVAQNLPAEEILKKINDATTRAQLKQMIESKDRARAASQ